MKTTKIYEREHKGLGAFWRFIDSNQFDHLLQKIVDKMFTCIILIGIPYFLYVLFSFIY